MCVCVCVCVCVFMCVCVYIQPIAFGVTLLQSQISIDDLVL